MSGPAIPDFPVAEFTRSAVPKKKTRRGGKGKATTQASQHLEALKSAHGQKDFAAARTHALNYAKASMVGGPPNPATQSYAMGSSQSAAAPDNDADDQDVVQSAPGSPKGPGRSRAQLAAIAIKRRPV